MRPSIDHGGRFALAAMTIGDLADRTALASARWKRGRHAAASVQPFLIRTKPGESMPVRPAYGSRTCQNGSRLRRAYLVGLDLAFRIARDQVRSFINRQRLLAARLESRCRRVWAMSAGLAGLGVSWRQRISAWLCLNAAPAANGLTGCDRDGCLRSGRCARAETALLAAQVSG